jgi:KaiC/GvpD/RAD55 family RecA-like ATPase
MEALSTAQRQTAEEQAEEMAQDATASAKEIKIRTGVRRLDDLVFGGLPRGSQVLINGPSHAGKDVLARLFVAEGLKTGIPALWVVTDKTSTQIREEMTGLLPQYPDFEARGLVRYVDLYSRTLGVTQGDTMTKLLSPNDKGTIEQLTVAVNTFSQDLREKAGTYRLVFESISTLTAYLDTSSMFRFLQPFVGRRKLDGAAAYYAIETGMHSDSDLQTLEHMMDGSVNIKIEQLKTFLSVKGITDAQSRAWIGFTFSKKSFSLGSFSLDHIR